MPTVELFEVQTVVLLLSSTILMDAQQKFPIYFLHPMASPLATRGNYSRVIGWYGPLLARVSTLANGETKKMRNIRVMEGLEDLTGRQFGTLKIGDMTVRRPEPRYRTLCTVCSTQGTETQNRLTSGAAVCRYAGCGKAAPRRGRDLLTEQRQQIADREAERAAEEQTAAVARMDYETEGWELPKRYAPAPEPYQPTSERERLAFRERREAEEQERIEAERPRLEAERRATEKRKAIEQAQIERDERRRTYWAEALLSGPDPRLFLSEAMQAASLPKNDADKHNGREAAEFVAATPEYAEYRTPSNSEKLLAYLKANHIQVFDVPTLKAAFTRLRDLGVLKKRTAVQPIPAKQARPVNLTIESPDTKPAKPGGPMVYRGRDYATGRERDFTEREVNRMSSTEYARAFPVLGTVSELFTAGLNKHDTN